MRETIGEDTASHHRGNPRMVDREEIRNERTTTKQLFKKSLTGITLQKASVDHLHQALNAARH
jgi:hypothetical protein